MKEIIKQTFGNKLRIRVCGICIQDEKLLLVCHENIGKSNILWVPPGGGMKFGETAEETLKREFLEETNLIVEVSEFLFVNEYLEEPLHAIELFFEVKLIGGYLKAGYDPELPENKQIIQKVDFLKLEDIQAINSENLHKSLRGIDSLTDFNNKLKGKYIVDIIN